MKKKEKPDRKRRKQRSKEVKKEKGDNGIWACVEVISCGVNIARGEFLNSSSGAKEEKRGRGTDGQREGEGRKVKTY